MRTILAILLLLLAAGGCDQDVELPGATAVVDAPAPQQPDDSARLVAPTPDEAHAADPLANVFTGQVSAISDGDTLTVLAGTNTAHRIRLQGIDAPEGEQPFSAESEQPQVVNLMDALMASVQRIEKPEKKMAASAKSRAKTARRKRKSG